MRRAVVRESRRPVRSPFMSWALARSMSWCPLRADPKGKLTSIIAGMAVDADSIAADLDVLRAGRCRS
jgi:hypothetical protein